MLSVEHKPSLENATQKVRFVEILIVNISKWYAELEQLAPNVPKLFAGNKTDLRSDDEDDQDKFITTDLVFYMILNFYALPRRRELLESLDASTWNAVP